MSLATTTALSSSPAPNSLFYADGYSGDARTEEDIEKKKRRQRAKILAFKSDYLLLIEIRISNSTIFFGRLLYLSWQGLVACGSGQGGPREWPEWLWGVTRMALGSGQGDQNGPGEWSGWSWGVVRVVLVSGQGGPGELPECPWGVPEWPWGVARVVLGSL